MRSKYLSLFISSLALIFLTFCSGTKDTGTSGVCTDLSAGETCTEDGATGVCAENSVTEGLFCNTIVNPPLSYCENEGDLCFPCPGCAPGVCAKQEGGSLWCEIQGEDTENLCESAKNAQVKYSNVTDIEVSSFNPWSGGITSCFIQGEESNVMCWGKNEFGQVGNGKGCLDYSDSETCDDEAQTKAREIKPVQVIKADDTPLKNVKIVKTGDAASCAITKDNGELYCWGRILYGKGDNHIEQSTKAVRIDREFSELKDVKQVSPAGGGFASFICIVTGDENTTSCWGTPTTGTIGIGEKYSLNPAYFGGNIVYPKRVLKDEGGVLTNITSLAPSLDSLGCAITLDNKMYCWGYVEGTNSFKAKLINSNIAELNMQSSHLAYIKTTEGITYSLPAGAFNEGVKAKVKIDGVDKFSKLCHMDINDNFAISEDGKYLSTRSAFNKDIIDVKDCAQSYVILCDENILFQMSGNTFIPFNGGPLAVE